MFARLGKRWLSREAPVIKKFEDIPGPRSLPWIGTLYQYLPIIAPGVNILWLFRPEDIETLYRNEGKCPQRRSHLALKKYRLSKPELYDTAGLLPTNGPEWWRIRKAFQKHLSKVQHVRRYLASTDTVVGEFVEQRIKRAADAIEDFRPELSRLFLEPVTYHTASDDRLQRFKDEEWSPDSESSKLIQAAHDVNTSTLKTDNGPRLWKKYNTPMYKRLVRGHAYIEQIALKVINKKMSSLPKDNLSSGESRPSLLSEFLRSKDTNFKDVTGMMVDTLLAGIDTTTYTCCFCLYHLASNADVQRKMFAELRDLLPDADGVVTETVLERATYSRAVVKESFRMNPIAIGIGRVLPKQCVFSGYEVPAGTLVVTQNQVMCRLDQYFRQPDRFVPERWLKDSAEYEPVSPYLVLPFGHGPRACIARRLSEQFLMVTLIKIVRNFEMSWVGRELDCLSLLINMPDRPISIEFKSRN